MKGTSHLSIIVIIDPLVVPQSLRWMLGWLTI